MDEIACKSLKKTFISKEKGRLLANKKRTIRAVDGISLSVRTGEVFGLVGPNGAGKTTTIKILSTLLIPDEGSAWVHGFDVLKQPVKVRESLGIVLAPDKGFYARLTGLENLVYYGRLYGMQKRSAKDGALRLLELVGLGEDANRLYDEYSLGMKAKLSIAKALIHDPPVLFLDEPTIGLDPLSARRIRLLVAELAREGKTILLTSHNMFEVDALCGRVAVINKGKIVAEGSPADLKRSLGLTFTVEVEVIGSNGRELPWPIEIGERGLPVVKVQAQEPSAELVKLVDEIRSMGLQVGTVRVIEPSLEEVFARVVDDQGR